MFIPSSLFPASGVEGGAEGMVLVRLRGVVVLKVVVLRVEMVVLRVVMVVLRVKGGMVVLVGWAVRRGEKRSRRRMRGLGEDMVV